MNFVFFFCEGGYFSFYAYFSFLSLFIYGRGILRPWSAVDRSISGRDGRRGIKGKGRRDVCDVGGSKI